MGRREEEKKREEMGGGRGRCRRGASRGSFGCKGASPTTRACQRTAHTRAGVSRHHTAAVSPSRSAVACLSKRESDAMMGRCMVCHTTLLGTQHSSGRAGAMRGGAGLRQRGGRCWELCQSGGLKLVVRAKLRMPCSKSCSHSSTCADVCAKDAAEGQGARGSMAKWEGREEVGAREGRGARCRRWDRSRREGGGTGRSQSQRGSCLGQGRCPSRPPAALLPPGGLPAARRTLQHAGGGAGDRAERKGRREEESASPCPTLPTARHTLHADKLLHKPPSSGARRSWGRRVPR